MLPYILELLKKILFRVVAWARKNTVKKVIILISLILYLPIINQFIGYNSFVTVITLLLLAQTVHIFFYFLTIYQYSKYTSVVKYFWIRVFTIFWIIELYLFGILIFLYFIAPAELKFFWDFKQVVLDKKWPNIVSVNTFIAIAASIFHINFFGYYVVYENRVAGWANLVVLTLAMVLIGLKELEVYYNYSLAMNYKKNIPVVEVNKASVAVLSDIDIIDGKVVTVFEADNTSSYTYAEVFSKTFNDEADRNKSKYFLLNVTLAIKFWHVYIIAIINLLYLYITVREDKRVTLEFLGVWKQNLTMLLIFWMTNYLIFFKIVYKRAAYGFYSSASIGELITDYAFILEELHLF